MSTERDTAHDNYQNFRYCYENGHQDWLIRASRCIRYRNNEQWDPMDKLRLQRAMRPALTFNVIESLVSSMKGIQRAMRNDVRFSPVSADATDTAQVQDALWLHVQNENSLNFLETEVWEHGLVTGRGYYDVRIDYDKNMKGNVKISGLRSQDVVLDPCIEQYDPETWPQVMVTRWTNPLEIEHMFGKEKAEKLRFSGIPAWYDYEDALMGSQLSRIPYFTGGWDRSVDMDLIRALRILDRQWLKLVRKEVFVDMQTGDTSEIPETWDREKIGHVLQITPGLSTMKQQVKQIMWTITCEDTVLHESESPYKYYTVVPFFPKFYDGYTLAPIETMLDPQDLYNKVTSQELHIINTTANSGYKLKAGSLKNMTIEELETSGAKSGVVFELDDVDNLEKLTPNQVPQGHDRISMKADSIMRSLGGVSNQSRGFAREDVAGEAIMANQAAMDINFADMLSKLHRSKQMLARRSQDCWQSCYNETRVLMINKGSTYRPEYEQMTLNQQTPEGKTINDVSQGEYTTVLVPAPARTTMSESEFEQLIQLRKDIGLKIPDDMMVELSNIPNKGQLLQQMKGASSTEAQQQQEQMQARIQELEMQLTQAKVEKEHSAAQLNSARAQHFQVESTRDPDAAYERVEMARIGSEHQLAQEKLASDGVKSTVDAMQRKEDTHVKTALELTKIDADMHKHHTKMDHENEMQENEPKPTKEKASA